MDTLKTNGFETKDGLLEPGYIEQRMQRFDYATVAYDNLHVEKLKKSNKNYRYSESELRNFYGTSSTVFFSPEFTGYFQNENNRKRLGYGPEMVKIRYKPNPKLEIQNGKTVEIEQAEEMHGPYPKALGQFIVNSILIGSASLIE
jgi:hypothetical protein